MNDFPVFKLYENQFNATNGYSGRLETLVCANGKLQTPTFTFTEPKTAVSNNWSCTCTLSQRFDYTLKVNTVSLTPDNVYPSIQNIVSFLDKHQTVYVNISSTIVDDNKQIAMQKSASNVIDLFHYLQLWIPPSNTLRSLLELKVIKKDTYTPNNQIIATKTQRNTATDNKCNTATNNQINNKSTNQFVWNTTNANNQTNNQLNTKDYSINYRGKLEALVIKHSNQFKSLTFHPETSSGPTHNPLWTAECSVYFMGYYTERLSSKFSDVKKRQAVALASNDLYEKCLEKLNTIDLYKKCLEKLNPIDLKDNTDFKNVSKDNSTIDFKSNNQLNNQSNNQLNNSNDSIINTVLYKLSKEMIPIFEELGITDQSIVELIKMDPPSKSELPTLYNELFETLERYESINSFKFTLPIRFIQQLIDEICKSSLNN